MLLMLLRHAETFASRGVQRANPTTTHPEVPPVPRILRLWLGRLLPGLLLILGCTTTVATVALLTVRGALPGGTRGIDPTFSSPSAESTEALSTSIESKRGSIKAA